MTNPTPTAPLLSLSEFALPSNSNFPSEFDFPADLRAQLEAIETQERAKSSRDRRPRKLATVDCETDPFHNCTDPDCSKCHGEGRIPKDFVWGVYVGADDEYVEFDSVEDFIAYIADKKLLFYAHNGGKFDYYYLRPYLNSDEPLMLINGRIAKARIGECEFRDSLNLFPNTRLADIGEKTEIDYDLMEPENRVLPAVRKEISLYLRQDCTTLYEAVDRYRTEYGKSLTQASASLKYWERMSEKKAPRQTKLQHDRYVPFYYGGRVQCFESGVTDTDFEVADINSAYPYAMLHSHAFSVEAVEERHLPADSEIYRCLIELDCTSRGAFPWRDPDSQELYFPDDEGGNRKRMRRYFITGWEFMAALEMNAISNIHLRAVHTFAEVETFRDYIMHHYDARLEADARGDKVGKMFRKYMMNSVYGKLGADPENYSEYVIATTDTYAEWTQPSERNGGRPYTDYQNWGDRFLLERKPTEDELNDLQSRWRYYNVATAASITGFVRAFLFKSLCQASGVIYCDTDSIAARDVSKLSFGKQLGAWKHEGTFDQYAIAGKKLYAFHEKGRERDFDPKADCPSWKVASKGVAFHADPEGPQKIIDLARGAAVTHRPEAPTYSITRNVPRFINRTIRSTAKDIRQAPDQVLCTNVV